MKKMIVVLTLVAVACAPAMAAVTCCYQKSGSTVTVKYNTNGNSIRAFALDMSVSTGTITGVSCSSSSPLGYYIYPGSIQILSGSVNSYGTCVCSSTYPGTKGGVGTSAVSVEMGSLYTGTTKPANSGTLLTFTISNSEATVTLEGNVGRGKVVMEDASETPTVTYSECQELPGKATAPTPADLATGVSLTTDLSWTAGSGATSHNVYWGTSSSDPTSRGNQTGTTYDTGTMACCTTYYWRIDEQNGAGITTGDLWRFTTGAVVPNILGLTESAANTAIVNACLTVGTKNYAWNASYAKDLVCAQSPASATAVSCSTTVNKTISRGIQPFNCLPTSGYSTQVTAFNTYVTCLWDPTQWCAYSSTCTKCGYQCHGDADGVRTAIPNNYRVAAGDLGLITSNWTKKYGTYPNGADPRADIDHKQTSIPYNYRVAAGDLGRVTMNWTRKDSPATGGLPRNCPYTDTANNSYTKP